MTSFSKTEMRRILHYLKRRTEPRPQS